MDYTQLTDQQINMLIAKIEHPDNTIIESISRPTSILMTDGINTWFDYCNNPADAWPIIVDNKIGIRPVIRWEEWRAEGDDSSGFIAYTSCDKNPLRCAMIVFLLMQDAKHG